MNFVNRAILKIAAAVTLSACSAGAALVTYDIDSNLSLLNLSGIYLGQPITPQTPGSLSAYWDGTITGDLVNGILTFSGGNTVFALENSSSPFLPIGTGTDNYGGQVAAFGALAVYRDLAMDFTAGFVADGVAPGGASTITMTAGRSNYFLPPSNSGTSTLTGTNGTNQATSPVTITESLGVETLTLPISFSFVSGSGPTQVFTGNLVATRSVPEPTSALLCGTGIFLLAMRRRLPVQPHLR
jgi:hypothetical protein